jgi:hypothetical protein
LALHGTPQTEPAAKLWWRTVIGALAIVLLQAIALHTTLTIFPSPQSDHPALGLPGNPGTVMKLLIVLCLLWSILKIPALMRRYVTKSSPSQVGTIVRVMLVQQLTRGLSRAAGAGRAGRTAAAASSRGPGTGARCAWALSARGGPGSEARLGPFRVARAGSGPTRLRPAGFRRYGIRGQKQHGIDLAGHDPDVSDLMDTLASDVRHTVRAAARGSRYAQAEVAT